MKARLSSPWSFFAATYGLSWVIWALAVSTGQKSTEFPTFLLYILGGCVPSFMGLVFLYTLYDKNTRQDFWKRLTGFKRISLKGYLCATLLPTALWLTGLGLDVVLGGQPPAFAVVVEGIAQPVTLIPQFVILILFGPLSEELGWRGYVLDRLQARYSSFASNCILALVWSLWHLPLFWIPGSGQNLYGLFTLSFWAFFLYVAGQSFLYYRIYTENHRSTLAVMLTHFSANVGVTLASPFSGRAYLFSAALFWLAAAVLWVVENRRLAVRASYSPQTLIK